VSTPVAERATHQELLDVVRDALMATGGGDRRLRMGMEMEFIPLPADGGTRIPLEDEAGGPSGTKLLRRAAEGTGWIEEVSRHGVPQFRALGTGLISFEPGGQLELSTDTFDAVDPLVAASRGVLQTLHSAAGEMGIDLVARGMDPFNAAEDASLFITADRYHKQEAHYASIGPWGRRMMLQTAAIHVNLDLGGRPVRRWWAANKMAPYLIAIFANSPMREGRDTGYRSNRAEQWRHLDPSRTGAFAESEDPVSDYATFALEAHDFLNTAEGTPASAYRQTWEDGSGVREWQAHLTTLFPEVRPRGYLELRSIDALPPWWIAVPLVICVGVLYSPRALSAAAELFAEPTPDRLLAAGREGLGDPDIRQKASDFFDVALEGASQLGEEVVGGAALEEARAFRDRFVRAGEDPGHESHGGGTPDR